MSTEDQLANAAYHTEAVEDALCVAAWVGPAGKESTEQGLPLPSALPEIGDTLGLAVPESARTSADVPRLHRAWAAAFGMQALFLEEAENLVRANPVDWANMSDNERIDAWAAALLTAVDAKLELPEFGDSPELCGVALEAIHDLPDSATEEQLSAALERGVLGEYFGLDAEQEPAEPETELAHAVSTQLPAEFTAFGVLDERRGLTSLAQWLRDELPDWGEPSESFQELLAGMEDKLAAAGVDPNDDDQMRAWLQQNPDELLSVLGDLGPDDDDDIDFATIDLKDAFELPDRLPPVSLPSAAELADDARASDVADQDADEDTALGAWCDRLYELLSGDEFLRPDGLSDEAIEAADEFELDFTGTGTVLAVMLFLSGSGLELTELRETVKETAGADLAEDDLEQEWEAWLLAYGDPVGNLLDRLGRLGATDYDETSAWLLPLGRYAIRERLAESGVSVALLPPPEEMSATELVSAVEGADEEELMNLASAWLAVQDPRTATTALLEVAADGDPVQRVFATAVANEIEPAHAECWEAVLDRDSLRPYAKVALARIHGDRPGENTEWEPSWDDLGWLLADTVASVTAGLEEDEVAMEMVGMELPEEGLPDVFEGVWRSGHPYAHEVLTMLGTHHPDTKTAKAARKAAFKAGSAG